MRDFNNSEKIKKICLNFLLDCYFGQSEDLLKAAIDRAYIDMASHTLKGFKGNISGKWECRYKAYTVIREGIIIYPKEGIDFASWREEILNNIEAIYGKHILNRGQAEKWLDMTIKYLYVFKVLIDEKDDNRFEAVKGFLLATDENDYQPPIDSYILKEIGVKDSWSSATEKEMKAFRTVLGEDKDFLWELEKWGELANRYHYDDSDSYNRYFEKRKKE